MSGDEQWTGNDPRGPPPFLTLSQALGQIEQLKKYVNVLERQASRPGKCGHNARYEHVALGCLACKVDELQAFIERLEGEIAGVRADAILNRH